MSTQLEEQIGVIGLLQAMFPFESELVLSADTARFLDSDLADPPQSLDMTLSIRLDEEQSRVLEMNICLLTAVASGSDFQEIRISPRQPNWLTRTEFVNLAAAITPLRGDEEPSDYILCMVNSIKEACQAILSRTQEQTQVEVAEEDAGDEALQRVWFWFPSLSTKEKRRDLVDYAPRYGLTGFVLAGEHIRTENVQADGFRSPGKPGLLCLEGDARKVDQYMSAIKSESWSDIPSYQKKVGTF
jgi:hypothetical protein